MCGATIPANNGRPSTRPDGSEIDPASFPTTLVQKVMKTAQEAYDFLESGRKDGVNRLVTLAMDLTQPLGDEAWEKMLSSTPSAMRVDNFSISFHTN